MPRSAASPGRSRHAGKGGRSLCAALLGAAGALLLAGDAVAMRLVSVDGSSDTDDEPAGRHIILWILLLGLAAAGTWWIPWQRRHGRK